MRKFILLFILLSQTGTSQAYDQEGVKYIYGIGNAPCSTFLDAFGEGGMGKLQDGDVVAKNLSDYVSYLDGYMSATNAQHMGKADYLGKPDRKSSLEWLASFCSKNAKETFDFAVSTYLLHLMAEQVTNKDSIINNWGQTTILFLSSVLSRWPKTWSVPYYLPV